MTKILGQQPDMLTELTRLEKLLPSSEEALSLVSKTIRNKVWELSNERVLAANLSVCNLVFGAMYQATDDEFLVIQQYVEYLKYAAPKYSGRTLDSIFDPLLLQLHQLQTQHIIRQQWRRINPYYGSEYTPDIVGDSKDFIAILDDFFSYIEARDASDFLKPLRNYASSIIVRGRRGRRTKKEDLAAPSIEIAVKNNSINRWNPPDKRYLYLAVGDSSTSEETSLAELRAENGEEITIGNFKILDEALDGLIVDFDYERICQTDILAQFDLYGKNVANEIVDACINKGQSYDPEEVQKQLAARKEQTEKVSYILAGKLLLKEICEAIFIPLDNDEDDDKKKKDRCYKSFHVLAEYFESKGYAGIAYPSTRMKLKGKQGTNLTLFNADSAEAIESTLRTIVVNDEVTE